MRYLLYLLCRPWMTVSKCMGAPPLLAMNTAVGMAFVSMYGGAVSDALQWMVPVFLFVSVDLAFGVRAAINRGERVTGSNAARRTVSKTIGYFCWVLGCCCWSQKTGDTRYASIGCGIATGIEALSAIGNYLEIHGYAINIKGLLRMLGAKFSLSGLEDTVEETGDNRRGCGRMDTDNKEDKEDEK